MIDPLAFEAVASEYRREYSVTLVGVDAEGRLREGSPPCGRTGCQRQCAAARRRAVFEALRWGDPSVSACPGDRAIWAVPLMVNSQVVGGWVAIGAPIDEDFLARVSSSRIREACNALRVLAERRNATNAALLALHRIELKRETERALAQRALQPNTCDELRWVCLREEPALFAAVKRGDRREARLSLHRLLCRLYALGAHRLDLLKSVALELAVLLGRAAVEAGADPTTLLGANYQGVSGLTEIASADALSQWLSALLERHLDAILDRRQHPHTVLLGKALRHMRERLEEPLDRASVARAAGLSPSHFSHLLRAKLGASFTALLRQYRVDRARELLVRTTQPLAEIAARTGFSDQSYFGKVFFKQAGMTPGDFRRAHTRSVGAGATAEPGAERTIARNYQGKAPDCQTARPGLL